MFLIKLTVLISCLLFASAAHQLISADGTCKSPFQINSYLQTATKTLSGEEVKTSCISFLDCSLENKGFIATINSLLKSSFEDYEKDGLYLDATPFGLALISKFESIHSNAFCGAKAVDFSSRASNLCCFVLSSTDMEECLESYDQLIRRSLNSLLESDNGSTSDSLLFLVARDDANDDSKSIESTIQKRFEISEENFQKYCSVATLNSKDESSVSLCRDFISEKLSGKKLCALEGLGSFFADVWVDCSALSSKSLLNKTDKKALLQIESAFTTTTALIDLAIADWQGRVGSGKLIGKFGGRVRQLLESAEANFYLSTAGSSATRERIERGKQLFESIKTSVTTVFRQQLALLHTQTVAKFKKLLKELAESTTAGVGFTAEKGQQLMRQCLFDLKSQLADIEVQELGLTAESQMSDLSAALEAQLAEFPESSAFKLVELKKLEKQVSKPQKKKGNRSVNVGLSLMGMLRPPGYGNLQGYAGYATSLLGLPFDLLLGVHNDGESPEVLGDDREYPILRLQPKVHFDIDI